MTSLMFAASAAATPISVLRQKAKTLAKGEDIKLHAALDIIAQEEDDCTWSELVAGAWSFEHQETSGSEFLISKPQSFMREADDGFKSITASIPREILEPEKFDRFINVPDWLINMEAKRQVYIRKFVGVKEGKKIIDMSISTYKEKGVSVEIPKDLAEELKGATTLSKWCSAKVKIFEYVVDKVPEDKINLSHEVAMARGYVRDQMPDVDIHEQGLRLQKFTGADGSVTWRVSLRINGQNDLHPDLYIPAGQIPGNIDPSNLASAILSIVQDNQLQPLSTGSFYAPGQMCFTVLLNLPSGPTVGTISLPNKDRKNIHNEWAIGRREALQRIQSASEVLSEKIKGSRVFIEDVSHLGKFDPDLGDVIDVWQWAAEYHQIENGFDYAFEKVDTQRPNVKMRFLDHHLVRGLCRLMRGLKPSLSDDSSSIENSIYSWSNEEHTNGSFEQEAFKFDCDHWNYEERGFQNRNARASLIVNAMARILETAYISHEMTDEIKMRARSLEAYYLKLPGGGSKIYTMPPK